MKLLRITMSAISLLMLAGGARAQETMGSVGAASSMSAGMSAQGGVNGANAMRGARGAGQGVNPETGEPIEGGAPGGEGAAAPAAPVVRRTPLRFGNDTGEDYLRELNQGGGKPDFPNPTERKLSPRASASQARKLARQTPRQRSRDVNRKYKKPPVGYLAYYLPQDRYKITSSIWKYVSIEDDSGRYPVKYYYRPYAAPMLKLLSQRPPRVRRFNRVIGFNTWQDALQAGYRPDPVSKPEPGSQLSYLARLARGPQVARYAEFLYAGQVAEDDFLNTVRYVQSVEKLANKRKYTKAYLPETVEQILVAALGEGPMPQYIGPAPPPVAPVDPSGLPEGAPVEGGGPPG